MLHVYSILKTLESFRLLNKYLKHVLVTLFDLDQTNSNKIENRNRYIRRFNISVYPNKNIRCVVVVDVTIAYCYIS